MITINDTGTDIEVIIGVDTISVPYDKADESFEQNREYLIFNDITVSPIETYQFRYTEIITNISYQYGSVKQLYNALISKST